jgi:glycosyltransferase involved in cell wall biosynthesis
MSKTLVILTPGFPKDEADTACITPLQLFVKAVKETHPLLNVIVLAFHYPFTAAQYHWHDIEVIALGGKDTGGLKRRLTWVKAWSVLKGLRHKYGKLQLLSFWFGECAYVGQMFAKKNRLEHYCWILGQDAKAGNRYVNKVNPEGRNLIALSDFIAREFNKNYGILPEHVIPVGVDPSLFPRDAPLREIDIIGVGSLIPLKQYTLFVDVVASLKKSFPNIKTMICGNGPEIEMLHKKIISLSLQDNIILTGELPNEMVLNIMSRSKILLHPSAYEGFGLVCLEALCAGAKVISFVRPMNANIENWYTVDDEQDVIKLAADILGNEKTMFRSVISYHVHDNARKLISLFSYKEEAIA